jgi:hypothetical protein
MLSKYPKPVLIVADRKKGGSQQEQPMKSLLKFFGEKAVKKM